MISYSFKKKHLLLALVVLLPLGWNNCGKKQFNTMPTDASVSPECLANPTPENCGDGDPDPDTVKYTKMTQTKDIAANNKVDILFIVDNSGSMEEEQIGIGNKISGFLDKIKAMDWQIAVTTTDPNYNTYAKDGTSIRAWGDGQFRAFDSDGGSQYFMKSTDYSASVAQSKLANVIHVGTKGAGDAERGINAAYRAVARSTGSYHKNFFRTGASFAAVIISDEDECGTGPSTGCPNQGSSVPQNYVNQVQSSLGTSKTFSFNSIIYYESTCTTGITMGNTYKQLTQLTGGVLGSVCSTDFSGPLAALGTKVADMTKSVSLNCLPQDINGDSKVELTVEYPNGTQAQSGFTVSGSTVTFTTALAAGTYKFIYYCKQ